MELFLSTNRKEEMKLAHSSAKMQLSSTLLVIIPLPQVTSLLFLRLAYISICEFPPPKHTPLQMTTLDS